MTDQIDINDNFSLTDAANAHDYDYSTPEELMEYFHQGDREAFRTLVRQFQQPLFAFLTHYLHDIRLAEDAFFATWRKIAALPAYDTRAGWKFGMYKIAREAAIDTYAGSFHADAPAIAAEQEITAIIRNAVSPQSTVEDLSSRLTQAVTALPLPLKEVFLLREDADLTFLEIGLILDCPPATVQKRLGEALDLLKNAVLAEPTLTALLERL